MTGNLGLGIIPSGKNDIHFKSHLDNKKGIRVWSKASICMTYCETQKWLEI